MSHNVQNLELEGEVRKRADGESVLKVKKDLILDFGMETEKEEDVVD